MATEFSGRFEAVSSSGVFTDRLRPALAEIMEYLPSLLSGDFPFVIIYSNFNKINILIDGGNGKITGVINWINVGI